MDPINHSPLTGKTVHLLTKALEFQSANHSVISGNLANMDTPGYRPKELAFNEALKQAVEKKAVSLHITNPNHFSYPTGSLDPEGSSYTLKESKKALTGPANVDLDREMAKMVRNNLLYETSTRLLSKKFQALRTVIESGRR